MAPAAGRKGPGAPREADDDGEVQRQLDLAVRNCIANMTGFPPQPARLRAGERSARCVCFEDETALPTELEKAERKVIFGRRQRDRDGGIRKRSLVELKNRHRARREVVSLSPDGARKQGRGGRRGGCWQTAAFAPCIAPPCEQRATSEAQAHRRGREALGGVGARTRAIYRCTQSQSTC